MEQDFFHTYIVGGSRDEVRVFIEDFLQKQNIKTQGNPDCVFFDTISFSVDHSRELKEWQSLAPSGDKKVYVVYADFITPQAENALLKTLEEPQPRTHIFFAVPKPEMLLPTLRSRARVIMLGKKADDSVDTEISKFLMMPLNERLLFVLKLAEKSTEDDASAEVRKNALFFVEGLENFLSDDVDANQKKLEILLKLKKYLYVPGSSVRNILETISFLV